MQLKVKRVSPDAVLPHYAHPGDAGMDVHATEYAIIPAHGFAVVHTGIAVELPPNTELQVRPRSGLAAKSGIFACLGTVDEKYRGEIFATVFNMGDRSYGVEKGDRICQFVVMPRLDVEIVEVNDISTTTERGTNGCGSTGI